MPSISTVKASPDELYKTAVEQWGASLERLATAYEADREKRRDLSQNIHFHLWQSFHRYEGRCSLRTWTYRIAHHVAASHVIRERRIFSSLVSLEHIAALSDRDQGQIALEQHLHLTKLFILIRQLKPLDRQVIVCWLEGIDAESIGDITGLSPANVAVRVSRVKKLLVHRFRQGDFHAG